jgi:hypothetical protein
MTISAGTRLGPYELLGSLGAGGMGEVYRSFERATKPETLAANSVAGGTTELFAVVPGRRKRRVTTLPGDFVLHDISAEGRVLLGRVSESSEILGDFPGETRPRNLSHLDRSMAVALAPSGDTLLFNERLFALLNVAMADAAISCRDAKYHFELWRPITAVRLASTDGNDATIEHSDWSPSSRRRLIPSTTRGTRATAERRRPS